MANPMYVGSAFTQNNNTSNQTVTVTYPAAAASGDLMILSVEFQRPSGGSFSITTPSGWTLLQTSDQSTADGRVFTLYSKIKAADTSVSVLASTATTVFGNAEMTVWRGDINQTTPIADSAVSYVAAAGLTLTHPSVTAATAEDMMVVIGHGDSGSSSWTMNATPPAGFTEVVDAGSGAQVNTTRPWVGAAYAPLFASGATGTKATTLTGSFATGVYKFAASVAIKSGTSYPQYVSTSTPVNVSTANVSVTATYPTSVSGDVLFLFTSHKKSSAGVFTVATPSGWTLAGSRDDSTATGYMTNVFWRQRAAETSVTVTASTAVTHYATISVFRGSIDTTTPVGAIANSYSTPSSSTMTCPTVTATVNNALLLGAFGASGNSPTHTWVAPVVMTADAASFSTPGSLSLAYIPSVASSTATGTNVCTSQFAVTNIFTWSIAVQPAQSATVNGTETGTGTDTATSTATTGTATDTGSGADNSGVQSLGTDLGTGADTAVTAATTPGSDTGAGSDTAVTAATTPGSDTGSGADTAAILVQVSGVDTGSGADTATVRVVGADTGAGTEQSTGFGQDTGSGADTANVVAGGTDSAIGNDSAFASNTAQVTDAGTFGDNAILAVPVTETGVGVDVATLNAKANAADTFAGADNATVIVKGAADSGAGVDDSKIIQAVGDSGSGVDTGSIRVTVFGFDSVAGADTSTIGVTAGGDTSSSTENASKSVNGFLDAPRVTIVQPETRTVVILHESRGIAVDSETRLVIIGFEALRTITIDAESRSVTIPKES